MPDPWTDARTRSEQERHDMAWYTLFELMSRKDTMDYDFNTSTDILSDQNESVGYVACDRERITFEEILKILDGNGGHFDEIQNGDMYFDEFFQRAEDYISGIEEEDGDIYLEMIDPQSSSDIQRKYCLSYRWHF